MIFIIYILKIKALYLLGDNETAFKSSNNFK